MKVAVTDSAALMVTLHVPVPLQAPLQPANVEPEAALAVSTTAAPLLKLALHVPGQLIPLGLLVTVPLPVPARVTVMGSTGAVTVKSTPLLATPPTVTVTSPVVAPAGTAVTIDDALQLVIDVAVVPLNCAMLVPCVAPKFDPVIVTEVPTGPDVEESCVMAGGLLIVNIKTLDVPPPGAGLTTVTEALPGLATSSAVMAAASCVLLTKVVTRFEPFHCTCDVDTNPLPFTVRLKAAEPATALDGLNGLLAEIAGVGFVNVDDPEFPQAASPTKSARMRSRWNLRCIANPLSLSSEPTAESQPDTRLLEPWLQALRICLIRHKSEFTHKLPLRTLKSKAARMYTRCSLKE